MDMSLIRMIAGGLAVALIVILILRRRQKS